MRVLTYLELSGRTEAELNILLRRLLRVLPCLPGGSEARAHAVLNIHHVRLFLARRRRRRHTLHL